MRQRHAFWLTSSALGIALSCAAHLNAGTPMPFTEEAQQRGIDCVTNQPGQFGDGVAFVDLDGDRDPDVVALGAADGTVGIYENDGTGFFVDRSTNSGIAPVFFGTGVIAGDYDLDGDLDLFLSTGVDLKWKPDVLTPNYLLRNDGSFTFTDVTNSAGVGSNDASFGCTWGDYDNDGWLDLYVSNRWVPSADRQQPNRLFHNLQDGTFEEVGAALGVDRPFDATFQSSFLDFDFDGDLDLYVANDKADCVVMQNHMFENRGGTFVDITSESGTEGCVWSMCIAIGDFDNNRWLDMYVTNLAQGNALMMNNGDGTFAREEQQAMVESYATGWGSAFFDYDNDGWLDLYVCNWLAPNRLYRHEGSWPATDVSDLMNCEDGELSYVVSTADIDNDGDVDFIVQSHGDPLRLYINHEGSKRRWAKFDVLGEGAARHAIGASIQVRTAGEWRVRAVHAGDNFLSQNDLIQHLGLADATLMSQVAILWPGGNSRTLHNLPTNHTWTLYPLDKLGDHDLDGDRDLADFTVFASCYDAAILPGCEAMDFDGNGWVDDTDYTAFLNAYDAVLGDCDENGKTDLTQILQDPLLDKNTNGLLDACECLGDIDASAAVDAVDLATMLGQWGVNPGSPSDLNGDGEVNAVDLAQLLGNWGTCSG